MKHLNWTGAQDFLALVFRRKTWVIVPWISLSCAIALLTYMLPRTYVSESLTMLRPRDVPTDMVRELASGSGEQRVQAIEQNVLSRTNLKEILSEFESDLPEYRGLNIDQKVAKLRNQIKVVVETRAGGMQWTYLRITYQNRKPETAQRICGRITDLFIEQDRGTRESQITNTTEFLTAELTNVSDLLEK